MEKEYRCAIIGQHPMRFPWGFDEEDTQCRQMMLELAQCIMELRQCGVTEFQVACDPGVGLYAGEIVNITKQNDEASIFKNFIHPHTLERFTFCKSTDIIIMNRYEAKNL